MKQPENSKLCGHCCLAIILRISLEESIKLIGHIKGTKTKELIKHFSHDTMKRGFPNTYSLCISRPPKIKTRNWHWVIYKDGLIYDPLVGEFSKEFKYKISSYIPIKKIF